MQPQHYNKDGNKMGTIRTKVYQFNELNDDAKQKAIEWYRNGGHLDYEFVWDGILYDAKEIGLNIISLDDYRPNKGEFLISAANTAELITLNHGKECETYKTAQTFLRELEVLTGSKEDIEDINEDEIEELEDEFLKSLLEDYRIMYNKELEYQDDDKQIIDTIVANEYEFTEDGKRF